MSCEKAGGIVNPFEIAWAVLKAPIWFEEPRDPKLLAYLRSAGQDPKETSVVQMDMGEEVRPQTRPKESENYSLERLNKPQSKGSPFSDKKYSYGVNPNWSHFFESPDKSVRAGVIHMGDNKYGLESFAIDQDAHEKGQGYGRRGLQMLRDELEAMHGGEVELIGQGKVVSDDAQAFWNKMHEEGVLDGLRRVE